jgi:hypothetical protein
VEGSRFPSSEVKYENNTRAESKVLQELEEKNAENERISIMVFALLQGKD